MQSVTHRPECDARPHAFAGVCNTRAAGLAIFERDRAEAEAAIANPVGALRDALRATELDAEGAQHHVTSAEEAMYRLRDAAVQRYPEGRERAVDDLTYHLSELGRVLDYIAATACEARS